MEHNLNVPEPVYHRPDTERKRNLGEGYRATNGNSLVLVLFAHLLLNFIGFKYS